MRGITVTNTPRVLTEDTADMTMALIMAEARRLIEAHARQQAAGAGAFAYEGKMVDMPLIRAAEQVIARAGLVGSGS